MKKFRLGLIIINIIVITILLVACEKAQIPFTLLDVKESKSLDKVNTFIEVSVTVPLGSTDDDLKRLLSKLLEDYKNRFPADTSVFTITAYGNNKSQSELAQIRQGFAGRIGFTVAGITTHDRPIERPILSSEEKARQAEVSKFAGELIKEAGRIRNNK